MIKKILNFLKNNYECIILIFVMLVSIFDNFFSSIIVLDEKTVLIILTGIICSHIIKFSAMNKRIEKSINTIKAKGVKIEENVNDAYSDIFSQTMHIRQLKIFTENSAMEQAHFSAQRDLVIDECILLLRILDESDSFYNGKYEAEVEIAIGKWMEMVKEGKIGKLKIIKFNKVSDIYYVIIDDKILITDLLNIDPLASAYQLTNKSPIYVNADTVESKEFIQRCNTQFEHYVNYYGKSDNIVYSNF